MSKHKQQTYTMLSDDSDDDDDDDDDDGATVSHQVRHYFSIYLYLRSGSSTTPACYSADSSPVRSLFWHTNDNMVWRQCTCMMNYVDQQTLKPGDDCMLPYQHLWTFDVLLCPQSVTAAACLWNCLLLQVLLPPSLHLLLSS